MTNPNAPNSTPINPNDTAFPAQFEDSFFTEGLTKREYFAAMALSGLAANTEALKIASAYKERDAVPRMLARMAVEYADALLKALPKES